MSWMVQNLIRNRTAIRTNPNIESDDYNNLLFVEKAYNYLRENKLITDFEAKYYELASDGLSFDQIEKAMGIHREDNSASVFIDLCNKIAFFLGGSFTDEGLIESLVETYSLTPDEINRLTTFINTKKRTKEINGK